MADTREGRDASAAPPRRPSFWRRWRLRRWLLLSYLGLLAASHAVRRPSPPRLPGPGQQVQSVEGRPSTGEPVTIAYRQWTPSGGTAGHPILLVHGSPGSGRAFEGLGPLLGERRRSLALDLPGFGASTRNVPDYSIRSHAEATLQWLDSLGIGRVHAVGFSLGGGVALEMHRADPGRLASLTLLSATAAQEFELLGDYHLNHAVHALQLAALWTLRELVPHFGALDDSFFTHAYARNFYDTDQRPLRGLLSSFAGPVLVVHGEHDRLVPSAAAREHHRIAPQSELLMLDGDHFLTFQRPGLLAPPILDFVARAEDGGAATRADAAAQRLRAAEAPIGHLPPVAGLALATTVLLIALATFVSEDLACIGAGLLIARGSLPWLPGVAACFAGIFVGDLLLYAAGRLAGSTVVKAAPLKWFVRPEDLARSCRWFTARGPGLILWGRFVPGTRLPTYVAAGVLRVRSALFSLWALIAAALWTPLLVGAAALFGAASSAWFQGFRERAFPWIAVSAVGALLAIRVAALLSSAAARRRFLARWDRVRRWEFWPAWLFYAPLGAWIAWLMVRHRSPTLFTSANPGFPLGGLVGESKARILSSFADQSCVATTWAVDPGAGAPARQVAGPTADKGPAPRGPEREPQRPEREAEGPERVERPEPQVEGPGREAEGPEHEAEEPWQFPLVVKPDVGERGAGVSIVRSQAELDRDLASRRSRTLLQEFVAGDELGVFYHRAPGEAHGRIFGITEKRLPTVTGDGRSAVRALIRRDARLRCQERMLCRGLGDAADRVPAEGERVVVAQLGNHSLGCEFRDGAHLGTPALEAAIDKASRGVPGFHIGRYDVRGPMDEMRRGRFKVIELNGVSSDATNVYDPRNSLLSAYRTLFRQWTIAFRIASANRRRGHAPSGLLAVSAALLRHFRPSGARWAP